VSSQYSLLRNYSNLSHTQQHNIEGWIRNLSAQVSTDYARNPKNKSRNNNHMFWAAWGVMAASAATNEPRYFDWAVKKYKKATNHIHSDGTLTLELERQSRAFLYHNFAISPLVMMAEMAAQNGVDLYSYNNGALHRLIDLVINDLENNQEYITRKTGKNQDMKGVVTQTSLAWVAPYAARFGDEKFKDIIKEYEPLKSSRLGGDLSYLYSQ